MKYFCIYMVSLISVVGALLVMPRNVLAQDCSGGLCLGTTCMCGIEDPPSIGDFCVYDSNCGGGEVCCQGQCVADGDCGGSGGDGPSCFGTINCLTEPLRDAVDPNNYGTHYIGENQYSLACPPTGNAQTLFFVPHQDGGGGFWYMNIHSCCPYGSWRTITGYTETYVYKLIPFSASIYNCYPDGEFVSTENTGIVHSIGHKECDEDSCWRPTIYWFMTTCKSTDTHWGCVPDCNSTAPSGISVVQGESGGTANVSWNPGTGGASQRLYVDESQTEVNNGCTTPNACEVSATLSAASNSYLVTGLAPERTYYFRVATYENGTCMPSQVTSYTTPNVTLAGRVYLDLNNNCATTTPWNLGGLTVSVRGTAYSGNVASDGRFGFYGGDTTPISFLDLTGYGNTHVPSTAPGCNQGATLTTVSNPSSTNYFYLTPYREAWWQAVGGSVYAGGSVRSELPSASDVMIAPGVGGAIGALMRASGSLDTGAGEVSAEGYSAVTAFRGRTMNYDYFAAHMGVTPSTVNYWAADTMNKPANDPERVFYYQNPSGSEASVTTPWTVASGESYVVFVNGDLRIAADVVVEEGGFLAYIVNGDVRVSPAVTDVAGLFVVDGVLSTETNATVDVPVEFQGSVVVWGGINFGRDLITGNVSQASETFVYRPDLLVNMPDAMKVFALRWEEVVPGTIGQ